MIVWAADHDRGNNDHTEIQIDVGPEDIHIHRWYDKDTLNRDIAILKLPEALPIGDRDSSRAFKVRGRKKTQYFFIKSYATPVKADYACLPTPGQVIESGTRCWTAGWGERSDGRYPGDLREVDLNIFSDEECDSILTEGPEKLSPFDWTVYSIKICAGSLQVVILTTLVHFRTIHPSS